MAATRLSRGGGCSPPTQSFSTSERGRGTRSQDSRHLLRPRQAIASGAISRRDPAREKEAESMALVRTEYSAHRSCSAIDVLRNLTRRAVRRVSRHTTPVEQTRAETTETVWSLHPTRVGISPNNASGVFTIH